MSSRMISREQLDAALALKPPNKRIGQMLIECGFVTENQLVQTLSLQLGVPWVSLTHIDFPRQFASIVPREIAERHCAVPIFVRTVRGKGDFLYVATPDPLNEAGLAEFTGATRLPTRPMLSSATEVRAAIRVFYTDPTTEVHTPEGSSARIESGGSAPNTLREAKKPQPSTPQVAPAGKSALSKTLDTSTDPSPPTAKIAPEPSSPDLSRAPKPERLPSRASIPPPTQSSPTSATAQPKMMALTLLDGTQVSLPTRAKRRSDLPPSTPPEPVSLRELVSALRAAAHGADASEVLGDGSKWEPVMAALISLLAKKGIIQDAEFMDEFREI